MRVYNLKEGQGGEGVMLLTRTKRKARPTLPLVFLLVFLLRLGADITVLIVRRAGKEEGGHAQETSYSC